MRASRHGFISSGECKTNDTGPLGRNVDIYDNIFYAKTPVPVGLNTPKIRNNIFYNVTGSVSAANHKIDPKLVNLGGATAASAMLQAGSPAINRGLGVTANPVDYAGANRPSGAYDIGAFEYVTSGKKPSAPSEMVVQ